MGRVGLSFRTGSSEAPLGDDLSCGTGQVFSMDMSRAAVSDGSSAQGEQRVQASEARRQSSSARRQTSA
jgi:hypothetical protein